MTFGPAPVPRSEVGNPCYKACMLNTQNSYQKKKTFSPKKRERLCFRD